MRIIISSLAIVLVFCSAYAQQVLASAELEADNVTAVTVDGSFCDVIIKSGSKVYLNGIIEGNGDEDDYEITTDIRGSELYVRIEKSTRSWDRIMRAEINLTIRDGVRVSVDNSSGDISATRISADEFEFESTSGDIELTGINGDLQVESTSGDVEINDVVGDLYSESTSGSQEFENVEGGLEANSTSGDIELNGITGNIYAKSTSGDIDVRDTKGRINLKTTSGDIEGYDIELTDDAELRASSGDIELDFINNLGEMSFDLQTSSGSLRVGSRSGGKSLYMKQGGYWVKGVTSSGSMRFGN